MVDMTGEYIRLLTVLRQHGFLQYSTGGFLSERDMGELGSRLDELNRIGEKRELIDWFANGVDGTRSLTDMAKTLDKLAGQYDRRHDIRRGAIPIGGHGVVTATSGKPVGVHHQLNGHVYSNGPGHRRMPGTIAFPFVSLRISARTAVTTNVRMLDTIRSPPDQTGDQHDYARIHQHANIQRVPDPLHPHAQQDGDSHTYDDSENGGVGFS